MKNLEFICLQLWCHLDVDISMRDIFKFLSMFLHIINPLFFQYQHTSSGEVVRKKPALAVVSQGC